MTDSNTSIHDVPALLSERRRYESWLAALEARRDSTPSHVFDRVYADYRNRLDEVAKRLATYRHAIEEERANVQARLSLLDAEERMRRDERAELDLRAHVGEIGAAEAGSAVTAVDDAIQLLTAERNGLQQRVDELSALLAEPLPPGETSTLEISEDTRIAGDGPAAPEVPLQASAGSRTPGGSFDELAFLDAVVGQGTPTSAAPQPAPTPESRVVRDDPGAQSLLAGVGSGSGREAPLASNVPANTPIVLRSSGAIEQSKTLKCGECGSMNYPTEWYCERCGAELAAL